MEILLIALKVIQSSQFPIIVINHQQIRFGLSWLFHGGIIGIIQNNLCGILIILLIIVDYSDYSLDYSLNYSIDYSFSLWLFRLFKCIIQIIAFSLYGLFAPDNFQTAFPPSSLHVISYLLKTHEHHSLTPKVREKLPVVLPDTASVHHPWLLPPQALPLTLKRALEPVCQLVGTGMVPWYLIREQDIKLSIYLC